MDTKIKTNLQRIALAVLLLGGCSNTLSQNKGPTYTFEFEVSNTDSSRFGRKEYDETGEIVSVSSLYRKDNIVYLVDPVHSNVKAVDLKTGKVTVSGNLVSENLTLKDIVIRDERILVSTDGNIVYVLNFSLSTIEVKQLNRDLGAKSFIINGSHLYIYSDPSDVYQNNNFDVSINAIRIDKDLSLITDTLYLGRGYNKYLKTKDGYELINNRKCLQSTQFQFCLEGKFPAHEYLCRNIFVNDNSISFFEFKDKKFKIVSIDVLL